MCSEGEKPEPPDVDGFDRAHFMTAVAADAGFRIDPCLAIFHFDDLLGAALGTFSAADTVSGANHRTGCQ